MRVGGAGGTSHRSLDNTGDVDEGIISLAWNFMNLFTLCVILD